jgi:hypothetical protein
MNKEEANQKMIEMMKKKDFFSEEEVKLFKELIVQCDLTIQNDYGLTPIMFVFFYNNSKSLNFSQEQFNDLIQHSDLMIQDRAGLNHLMYAFTCNQKQNLNLNQEQIDYLIEHIDLTHQAKNGWTSLMFALRFHQSENLQFTKNQFQVMYDALTEEEQQNTFQKFIEQNHKNNHKYLKEINLFLYDLNFQPNKKTIKWLQENQYQDILQMIEKRDVFFQLNKDIQQINKTEKIDKMKI